MNYPRRKALPAQGWAQENCSQSKINGFFQAPPLWENRKLVWGFFSMMMKIIFFFFRGGLDPLSWRDAHPQKPYKTLKNIYTDIYLSWFCKIFPTAI